MPYKYFTNDDFKRASPACSIDQMSPDFLAVLDRCRETAGIPFVVNSAYRTKVYETNRGRSGNSAHTRGLAVDIRCSDSLSRYKIVFAAIACGVARIGIGSTFVHLDMDSSLPHPRIWLY